MFLPPILKDESRTDSINIPDVLLFIGSCNEMTIVSGGAIVISTTELEY